MNIGNDYFDMTDFSQTTTNNIIVELYEYNHYTVTFKRDISYMIVDYSYECTSDDNIHQSINLTLHVETDEQWWFMPRENKMREWIRYRDDSHEHLDKWSIHWIRQCYHVVKTYTNNDTGEVSKIDLGYFIPINDDYNYSPTDGTLNISLSGMSVLLTKEHGGGVVSDNILTCIIDRETHSYKNIYLPTSLSFEEGLSINSDLIFNIAKGDVGTLEKPGGYTNYSYPIPIKWAYIGQGQKIWTLPYDMDFDNDIGRADMLQEVIDLAFEGATFWIDEDRVLNVSSKPILRDGIEMFWREYGNLFLSESSTYSDDNFYNIVEVFGKDNNSYAICDWSSLDGLDKWSVRKQTISDDTLQSDEECYARAQWECYKSRYGHQTWTITLADMYIPKFNKPSKIVGKRIEYTTVEGDTNLFFLNKLSCSDNKWTMELSLFRPLYETEMLQMERQLRDPVIYSHEIIDNKYIRLYVTGEDIQEGLVKIYNSYNHSEIHSFGLFCKESCNVASNGIDKYVDIEIQGNGTYHFYATLYNPLKLDSGMIDDFYTVTVDLPVPEKPDLDPYPHPPIYDEGGHKPYLLDSQLRILTDADGNALTI